MRQVCKSVPHPQKTIKATTPIWKVVLQKMQKGKSWLWLGTRGPAQCNKMVNRLRWVKRWAVVACTWLVAPAQIKTIWFFSKMKWKDCMLIWTSRSDWSIMKRMVPPKMTLITIESCFQLMPLWVLVRARQGSRVPNLEVSLKNLPSKFTTNCTRLMLSTKAQLWVYRRMIKEITESW